MTDPTPASAAPQPAAPAPRAPHQTPADPDAARLREAVGRVRTEVGKAVIGQDGAVSGLLIALLSRGHALIEGVPGVAKTLLV
ncbi:MAG: AAA family ATPase, partial [Microbacterium gubbeenense]